MRNRPKTALGLAALLCVIAGPSACGDDPSAIRIYASNPLQAGTDIARAEQLAISEAHRRAGAFKVQLVSLDNSSPELDRWDPKRTERIARRAAADRRAVAYIGEQNSDATAISAPILNRAGMLQVATTSSYVGLTRRVRAKPDEPGRYRPTGRITLTRIIPADHVQAGALVAYMRREGVRRLHVVDDTSVYGAGLSGLVRRRLAAAGIREVGFIRDADIGGNKLRRMARRTPADADAVLYSANLAPGMIRQVHKGAPRPKLFVPDSAADALLGGVDGAERAVRMTAPLAGDGSATAQAFARSFREHFGTDPNPAAYYGYEAMKAVLAAIEAAGQQGNRREAVLQAFLRQPRRNTVLGDYAFDRNGDSTLRSYGTYRVKDRQLVFTGAVSAG